MNDNSARSRVAEGDRAALGRRLRLLGLPLVVEPSVRRREMLPRSAGPSIALALILSSVAAGNRANSAALAILEKSGGDELALDELDMGDPTVDLLLLTFVLLCAAPVAGVLVALGVRRAPRPVGMAVGVLCALALLIGPLVAFGTDYGPGAGTTVAALVTVLAGAYLGVGTILRWSGRRVLRELTTLGPMIARILPVLMLAFLFFFYNAEIWQVMFALSWERVWWVVTLLLAFALGLIVLTTRDELRSVLAEHEEERPDDVASPPPLRRVERLNLLLVPVLVVSIQTLLFAVVVFGFFLFFGWLSVTDATANQWTGGRVGRFSGLLSGFPVTTTLAKVALTLSAFSALNFAASSGADRAHRARFVDPLLDEVVHGLAVRDAYIRPVAAAAPDR